MPEKILVCIVGPTAVGKTSYAIKLARHFQTEIISADSRQFYVEMNIGTAKPSPSELSEAKHHFVGTVSIEQLYSAGDFERNALTRLDEIFRQHDRAIMVGGSGLYIKAVCEGLDDRPRADEKLRKELQELFVNEGIAALQERLKETNHETYAKTDVQNPQRVMRAIEIAEQEKLGYVATGTKSKRDFRIIKIGLNLPREQLYSQINSRVDIMMESGLLEEARALYPKRHLNALQTVGYTELFDHFDGKHSLERAVELIKQHTRNFAKRQLTWFRKDEEIVWVDAGNWEAGRELCGVK